MTIQELSNSDLIRSRIFTIRGVQVMLDRDLAELYGVATKVLNQAVKRNIERFPERYMFQLNKDDVANMRSQIVTGSSAATSLGSQDVTLNSDESGSILRSQFVTSRWGGARYLPYAFTEHGIIMLASVLNSPTAVEASVRIARDLTVGSIRRTHAAGTDTRFGLDFEHGLPDYARAVFGG